MTPEAVYNIDLNETARINVPKRLRNASIMAFVRLIVAPFIIIYQVFKLFRDATIYDLTITPQVCYVEKILNDRYDPILRGIYTDDAIEHNGLYLFLDPEDKPVILYTDPEEHPVPMFTDGEIDGAVLYDFIVFVPLLVTASHSIIEISSLINRKRLPGMRFAIQIY